MALSDLTSNLFYLGKWLCLLYKLKSELVFNIILTGADYTGRGGAGLLIWWIARCLHIAANATRIISTMDGDWMRFGESS